MDGGRRRGGGGVCSRRQGRPTPILRGLGPAAQGEAPETEHFFDDAEDRFGGLLPKFIEHAAARGRRAATPAFGQGCLRRRGRGSERFSLGATVRPWGSGCSAAWIVRPGLASFRAVTAASLTKPRSTHSVSDST